MPSFPHSSFPFQLILYLCFLSLSTSCHCNLLFPQYLSISNLSYTLHCLLFPIHTYPPRTFLVPAPLNSLPLILFDNHPVPHKCLSFFSLQYLSFPVPVPVSLSLPFHQPLVLPIRSLPYHYPSSSSPYSFSHYIICLFLVPSSSLFLSNSAS